MPRRKMIGGMEAFPALAKELPDNLIWNPAVQAIAPRAFELSGTGITAGHELAAQDFLSKWAIAQHWVYKLRWKESHKIPGQRKANIQNAKPFARVLIAWINLCWELHGTGDAPQYKNAGEWFIEICRELQKEYLSSVFGTSDETIFNAGVAGKIAMVIKRADRNPFDLHTQLHQWRVADRCLQLKASGEADTWKTHYKGSQRCSPLGLGAALSAFEVHRRKTPTAMIRIVDGKIEQRDRDGWVVLEMPVQNATPESLTVRAF